MTAEIAVINKGAIALAADSKVTVTSGGVTKTYDTVSKLFTLSKCAPVGVMIYGNADFMGFPWETIIKMYRRSKGRDVEGTVVAWADDFFQFLDSFGSISPDNKADNVYNICLSVITEIIRSYEDWCTYNGLQSDDEGLRERFEKRAARIIGSKEWITKRRQKALIGKLAPQIANAIDDTLSDYSEETRREAMLLLVAILVLQESSPQMSGVVFAGFGEDEIFPTLVEYRVDGYVGDSIKRYIYGPVVDISRDLGACVRAFAQGDMVIRFMDGIDPRYSSYLREAVPTLVVDNCFETLEKYGANGKKTDAVKEKIREAVDKAVEGFEDAAAEYRVDHFSDPVIRMVSVLPKDELAHLAESLVALTSLKRRVSSDAETVGGPVDVALISKGDGFVWIKRKHYFEEELNRQFVRTYMDDVQPRETQHAKPQRASRSSRAAASPAGGKSKPGETPRAKKGPNIGGS